MKRPFILVFLIIVISSVCVGAQSLKFRQSTASTLEERLKVVPENSAERLKALREMFVKAGCAENQIKEQAVPDSMVNLMCEVPGKEAGSLIFSTSYEYESKGDEAKVRWATAALLPALAESLRDSSRRFSLVLIAFGGRDQGISGAKQYLKQLDAKQRKAIVAMVDLDRLGRTPVGYHFPDHEITTATSRRYLTVREPGHVDTPMNRALIFAADALEAERPAEIRETPRTAAKAFFDAKIQSLALHSPAYVMIERPGRTEIQQARTALDPKVYHQTYQLVCVYALVMDAGLKPPAN